LNLTKYISEIAAALVEAKLKMTDVQAAVNICIYLHRHYAEFTSHLLENWQKALNFKKDDKVHQILIHIWTKLDFLSFKFQMVL